MANRHKHLRRQVAHANRPALYSGVGSHEADQIFHPHHETATHHVLQLGIVIGRQSPGRADRPRRGTQHLHRPYEDAQVVHLPEHNYFDNTPVFDQVSAHSHGNINGKAAHKEHWADRASQHSPQRDHENPAKVDDGHSIARGDLATGHLKDQE
jgi:hypothetical protein